MTLQVIFDGSSRFWLPVDFRFAPKADLRQCEAAKQKAR